MVDRDYLINSINAYLGVYGYKDYGPMGLQFIGTDKIKKVATAVSVSVEAIAKAHDIKADILLVHHGLFWNNEPRSLDYRMGYRLQILERNNLNLAAYHIALDAHPEIGNNMLAAKVLGIKDPQPFAEIGWGGEVEEKDMSLLMENLREAYYYTSCGPFYAFPQGEKCEKACVVTGAGGHLIHLAKKEGYDLFLTGEAQEPSKHLAKDLGISFVAAGHYATEIAGIKALGDHVANTFDIDHEFIHVKNPV